MPEFTRDTEHGPISISYKKTGNAGDPVFLLHGLGEDKSAWQFQIAPIAKAGFTVYAHDARGFGRSTRVEEFEDEEKAQSFYSLENDVTDVIALMDHVGVEKGHLVGHSMGGLIAQVVSALYPDRVITTIIANSFSHPHPRIVAATRAWQRAMENMPLKEAFDVLIPWIMGEKMMTSPLYEALISEVRKIFVKTNTNWCFANKIKTIRTKGPELLDYIKKIKNPVLLIGGGDDVITPPRYQDHTKSVIPQAEIVIIPKVGHQATLENPVAFNKAIIDFLKNYAIQKVS
ncbi:MAG: alpha/beta hydrolase [Candidatus Helarchaeota archaeon]|nr:alpha/beta hydrolase [Candidatus Helarchaeota archaeon]